MHPITKKTIPLIVDGFNVYFDESCGARKLVSFVDPELDKLFDPEIVDLETCIVAR